MPERALADLEQADGDAHPPARASPSSQQEEREAEIARERGAAQDIGFGGATSAATSSSPYQLVKDHRTGHEIGNAQGVLDGDLDGFIHAYLLAKAAGEVV